MIIPSAETSETSSLSNNTAKRHQKSAQVRSKFPRDFASTEFKPLFHNQKAKPTTYYTEINQTEETKPVKMDIPVFRQQ